MCKISGIRPDNNATWIWKFQILEDFWWASTISNVEYEKKVYSLNSIQNLFWSDHSWQNKSSLNTKIPVFRLLTYKGWVKNFAKSGLR